MEWDLLSLLAAMAAIGTTTTAMVTTWRWVIKPFLQGRALRLQERRKEIEAKILEHRRLRNSIDYNLRNSVENLSFEHRVDIGLLPGISSIDEKASRYNEAHDECRDWFEAASLALRDMIERLLADKLPKTQVKYPELRTLLLADEIKKHLAVGGQVSRHWIEQNYPSLHEDIMNNLQESERSLNDLFLWINRQVRENRILARFRQRKEALTVLGRRLMEEADAEAERLEAELGKIR